MSDPLFTLPLAVLPEGADPATFYGSFAGKLTAEADGDAVSVWLADDDSGAVYAPVKAALRFAPAGSDAGTTTDTLVLSTWPLVFPDLRDALPSPAPTEIRIGNVDSDGVRAATRDLYVAIGKPETSVDAFLAGDGLLLVAAGAPIGTAAAGTSPPDPSRPNQITVEAADADGAAVNVTQLFADGAAVAGIDATLHPLLAAIPPEGWIDVVVLDEAGDPLAAEAYDLYLSDGSIRSGVTGTDGRIAETGMPDGPWALDLPGQPSFGFVEA